jgi:hypothetical protein
MPVISSPSNQSSTIEASIVVSGTAEANARVALTVYTAASGGTQVSQVTNVPVSGTGTWTANSVSLRIGDNYLETVAVDLARNHSSASSPRVKVTRTNILPGTIIMSPVAEVSPGDSGQWVFTYTAASVLNDNCQVKIGIPPGWTEPQINSSSQPGFSSVTAGSGTVLDATALTIINLDTIRVDITSMSQAGTFTVTYGSGSAAGYAKLLQSAICGTNTFGCFLNDTIAVAPPSLNVRGRPIGVSHTSTMPATVNVGQTSVRAMQLSFTNTTGIKNKRVTAIILKTEKSGGAAVNANTRLTALRIISGGVTCGSVSAPASSSVSITLSTPIEIGAGATVSADVYIDIKSSTTLKDSTIQISLVDSIKITAIEAQSGTSVDVHHDGADVFPQKSISATITVPTAPDSLMVMALNLLPATNIGELEKSLPVLRFILRHPGTTGGNIKVTKIKTDISAANPATAVVKKILRRKGDVANLYASTSIETVSPMIFDLSVSPIVVAAGVKDTIDLLIDVVAAPPATLKFTLLNTNYVTAKSEATGDSIAVKADGVAMPCTSITISTTTGTSTPSGKDINAALADWNASAERIETSNGTEEFYITWDHSNLYYAWNGRNLGTNGNLFIYMNTGKTGGSTTTWNYGGGNHFLPTKFNGANYCFYFDNTSAKGLRDGNNSYASATFTGDATSSGTITEVRIPLANLGSPDSIKIIPVVQQEGSATIAASMPFDNVGEFSRNPTGAAPQSFLSWIKVQPSALGVTPKSNAKFDSSSVVRPTWTYDLGAGNYAAELSIGTDCIYVSVGGTSPRIISLASTTGALNWSHSVSTTPTGIASYWEADISGYDMLMFCEGTRFHAGYDQVTGFSELGWSPKTLGGTGGSPSRSIPDDGGWYDTVYAYIPCADGKLYKYHAKTGAAMWASSALNVSYKSGCAARPDRIFIGTTNGYVRAFNPLNGALMIGATVGDSVITRLSYKKASTDALDTTGVLYVAPKNNTLYSFFQNLSQRWNYNVGAVMYAAPFYNYTYPKGKLYCPAGNYVRALRDDTTRATLMWTYQTGGTITSDPASLGKALYFSSDDKRNFAVDTANGANISGWPSAVLSGANRSRVVVDGAPNNSVFFGGGDTKVYRYPKQ